jgi:hypothetical protein
MFYLFLSIAKNIWNWLQGPGVIEWPEDMLTTSPDGHCPLPRNPELSCPLNPSVSVALPNGTTVIQSAFADRFFEKKMSSPVPVSEQDMEKEIAELEAVLATKEAQENSLRELAKKTFLAVSLNCILVKNCLIDTIKNRYEIVCQHTNEAVSAALVENHKLAQDEAQKAAEAIAKLTDSLKDLEKVIKVALTLKKEC